MSKRAWLVVGVAGVFMCLSLAAPGLAWGRPASRVKWRSPARVVTNGLASFRGQAGRGSHLRVRVERRSGSRWIPLVAGRPTKGGKFVLTWIVSAKPGRLRLRAVVSRSGHVVAVSSTKRMLVRARRGPRIVVSPKTVVLSASTVTSAPKPGSKGVLRYTGGDSVRTGQILAIGRGPATPFGFLGQVTSAHTKGAQTVLTTKPATLLQAIRTGSFDVSSATKTGSLSKAARRAFRKAAESAFTCTGSTTASIAPSLSFGASLQAQADWSFNPFSFGLKSASVTAQAHAAGSLTVTLAGQGSCTLPETEVWKTDGPTVTFDVGPLPVVITSELSLGVKADANAQAALTAGLGANFDAKAGIGWQKGSGFYPISSYSQGFTKSLTISASASAEAALVPKVQLLFYGFAGGELDLSAGLQLDADISKNPWWTLGAPIDLSGKLTAPPLGLSSSEIHIYNHIFPLAQAAGSFGGGPTVTVTNPGAQISPSEAPASLQIHATDSAGEHLTYTASGLPAGLTINSSTGLISGTPTTLGTSTVTVKATDTDGVSAQVQFAWTITATPSGLCEASSSVFVLTTGSNVVAYVPKGNWDSSTTGLSLVNVEGSSVTPTLIDTPNVVNSAASNPFTGETVATANNTDVYLLNGPNLVNTLTSGGSGTIGFSGGSPTDAGVAMDPIHNQAVIALSIDDAPGFQLLDLSSNTFYPAVASPDFAVSEDPLIDPARNLLLSADEDGNFEIADISNPAAPAFYENATGGGELDSTAEDCSTGIVLAPAEFSGPSSVYIADLTQATLVPGSPAGTWSAPSQNQSLSESSLSAGASAAAVAQGTHTGVLAGEFGGNEITAVKLPATSGSGTPAITDWVTCGIDNTPDSNPWNEGDDPHTMTAYQTPNSGDAIGLFENEDASWLARVDLSQLLDPTMVPRDTDGHACAAGTIPPLVEGFIPVP